MKRCAVYTRKSTEEGLEQDFNSLHAQREACEAYIKSQKHEGWKLVRTRFDDGGLSGGTLDRPALQSLLSAIDRNEVDVVVVYKVDRLTRSLADFAKIVERFDERGVSFVSVTQQFNTTSSMGRLTLNVLLSFAQFEREVTAERIRDKIAASKKKGMWMGGPPPLGYDVRDKKLVVNDTEAETVRTLYRLYLDLGAVRELQREADRRGILTKRRLDRHGRVTGGKPFSRGNLYRTLSNPLYAGRVRHRQDTYPGAHPAIVDDSTWRAVQTRLADNAPARHNCRNAKSQALLTGMVFDDTGDRLSPIHATKAGKRYRYYISRRLMHGADTNQGWRLPAGQIEGVVLHMIGDVLTDPKRLVSRLALSNLSPGSASEVLQRAATVAEQLRQGTQPERLQLIQALVARVDLDREAIALAFHPDGLRSMLGLPDAAGRQDEAALTVSRPVSLRRRGVESKLVLTDTPEAEPDINPHLCRLVATAHRRMEGLANGDVGSVREFARREGRSETAITRCLPFAFLAPDIVEAILEGRQPERLTVTTLRRLAELPADWQDQRRVLGF